MVGGGWNVRLSRAQTPELIDKFRATFQAYWTSPDHGFETYDPAQDSLIEQRLREALARARVRPGVDAGTDAHVDQDSELSPVRVHPYPFQQEMLDDLDRERAVYGRSRNLVVAATGTGKTVIAAFDYDRLWRQWGKGSYPSLLFVAHRAEILRQSRRTFRHVLNRGTSASCSSMGSARRTIGTSSPRSNLSPGAACSDATGRVRHRHRGRVPSRASSHVPAVARACSPAGAAGTDRDPRAHGWARRPSLVRRARRDGAAALGRPRARTAHTFHYFGVGHEDLDFRKATWSGGYRTADLDLVVTGNDILIRWVIQQVRQGG